MAEFPTINPHEPNGPISPSTADLERMGLLNPDDVLSGTLRGTQNVGGTRGIQIDSANNRITLANSTTTGSSSSIVLDGPTNTIIITNTDGSKVGLGKIPGSTTDFGFFVQDANGNLVSKIVGPTMYAYDIANSGVNVMQLLKLPDGTYGFAVANTGQNVSAGFS